jgi:hypothetical protein
VLHLPSGYLDGDVHSWLSLTKGSEVFVQVGLTLIEYVKYDNVIMHLSYPFAVLFIDEGRVSLFPKRAVCCIGTACQDLMRCN